MSRVEPLQTSSLAIYPLSSSESRQALSVFAQLLSSCAGPHGRNHIVRNSCGGHLTISSTSSRLLSSISLSRSELKLVVSAIMGHIQQFGDCGLFMSHMCLQLTKSVLDLDINHNIVSSTFQCFVSIIVDYIESADCRVCVQADFTNVQVLLAYVRSILTSKTLLNIPTQDVKDLSLTTLNAFVKAIPSVPRHRYSTGVFVIGVENVAVKNCKCVDGIMLECPDLLSFGDSVDFTLRMEKEISEQGQITSIVKTVLITCSLSGDMDEIISATFEASQQQFNDLEENVIDKLVMLCNVLEKENVGLVLCQKVIHPKIKRILKAKGIIFVDRIGLQPIPFIRDLTGCHPVTSILHAIQGDHLGKLTSVDLCNENNKNYICMKNSNTSVVTLIVCAQWEERLSELKICVNTCLQGLGSLAKEPRLLMGGGCWQMHCTQVLKQKVLSSLPDMSKQLSCTETTLRQLLTVFQSCLRGWCHSLKHDSEHLSLDPLSFHGWRVPKNIPASLMDEKIKPCSCGFKEMLSERLQELDIIMTRNESLISNDGLDLSGLDVNEVKDCDRVILDSFPACVSALQKGVLTCGLLLSIGQVICDRN